MRAVRERWFALALGAVMLGALALRLWGHRTGLPYVYNVDEGAHFVPRAVGMFDHDYDPHYFINPPALTYVLHAAFWLRWGGGEVRHLMAAHPAAVFAFSRVVVAVLATLSVGALAWAAVRLFDRRVAIVAAALLAVAFLPVHYGHFALNDAALVLPVCVSLAGSAGVLATGHRNDYLLAGLGLGVAVAFKYTAGMVAAPLVAAAALSHAHRLRGLVFAALVAAGAFLLLNPYSVLSLHDFATGLREQGSATGEGGKLGLPDTSAVAYYARTLLWGLGVVPVLAAVLGGAVLWIRRYRAAMLLLPGPLLFLAFMGTQDRFFARWFMPAYPFLILLAAFGAVWALDRVRRVPAVPVAAVLLGLQGLIFVVHNDTVLARTDTRAEARVWLVGHIPAGAKVVIEPFAPDAWGDRWTKRAPSHFRITPRGHKVLVHEPKLEDYEGSLRPNLIGSYLRGGYCWVVTGSILSGRPAVTPRRAPYALRYYRALRRRGDLLYTISPFHRGESEPFSFDDSYNYRPFSYARPGPAISVYRLHGGRCA